MAKWIPTLVQDAPAGVIATANQWHVIKAYSQGDSYATVMGNSIGYATMGPGDYVLTGGANSLRTLTFASGKSFTSTAATGAAPNLHFAFVDSVNSRVLYVTDETTDAVIGISSMVQLPSGLTYTTSQTPS